MSKSFLALLTAASLVCAPAFALENSSQSDPPLAPGAAAGVQKAQGIDAPLIVSLLAVAGVAAAIVFVVSNSNGSSQHTTGTKASK